MMESRKGKESRKKSPATGGIQTHNRARLCSLGECSTAALWSAGGELREKKENQKRKILKIHVAFDYCSIQSTVHENCYNSQSGKKWQPKIGQNMPKTSSNPNFCLKMRHNEAQLRTIQTNLAHFRTKFKLKFT